MQCAECLSHNDAGAAFCAQCGARIEAMPTSGRFPKILTVMAVLFLLTVLVGGWAAYTVTQRDEPGETGRSRTEADANSGRRERDQHSDKGEPAEEAPVDLGGKGELRLAVRRVTFSDVTERVIGSFEVVVSGDGWLPVPRRVALAARDWRVEGRNAAGAEVVEGVWRRGEALGLWRLDRDPGNAAPLMVYDESEPLTLHPLDGGPIETIPSPRAYRDGSFLFFETQRSPGALVQENGLVGWVLEADTARGGWLWPGPASEAIRVEMTVEDFYAITFGGGREEAIGEALNETDLARRLDQLATAWGRQPKLSVEETPAHLQEQTVLDALIRDLVALRDQGQATRVAQLLTADVINLFRRPELLLLAVDTWDDAYGDEAAIALATEWWSLLIAPGSDDDRQLGELVRSYYQRWLYALIEQQQIDAAWGVFEEGTRLYPDDPDLHLRGVELQLWSNDWAAAEAQLDARAYPAALRDRVELLRGRIRKLKALEGKVVLRFRPGSRQIPATATLNGRVNQEFIVDTGASVTTMPHAAARDLGIRITDATPKVKLRTAGGDVFAAQVVLDSVTLGGWTIENVRVVIHDLPGNETLGLLGINFLRNFNVDLRTDEGMLVLEPR
ncbi:MAG: retropepsin-like aspartic protease [Planctomycetota bacterium]